MTKPIMYETVNYDLDEDGVCDGNIRIKFLGLSYQKTLDFISDVKDAMSHAESKDMKVKK